MMLTTIRRFWPGLLALAWLVAPSGVQAQGNTPIPIATDAFLVYRFNVKIGPSAFARPAGPWYSYFPVDPNLLAQPQAAAFPNWPSQFPPTPALRPAPGMAYSPAPMQYGYGPGVYPAGYYAPQQVPAYWYPR